MGKTTDEEQNHLRASVGAGSSEASGRDADRGFFSAVSGFVGVRCFLVLLFSAAVFLSALFWLPPFVKLTDQGDLDHDSLYKDHEIVASFNVKKPVSSLDDNILQLENDIFDEIAYMTTKVVVLSLEPSEGPNVTKVVFAIDHDTKDAKISPEIQSIIRGDFESLVINQSSLRLNRSLFGEAFLFEVLKFPGGITVIPTQSAFLLQKVQITFNFTLNFSIYQIQTNFDELRGQLKMGLHLAPYENLYVSLSNSQGSTVAPPTTVQSSVLFTVGKTPLMPRLKQLAQTITGSHSKNLGLNNTVFGRVKQVRLSSILQHSLHGNNGGAASWSPSPTPVPQPHHHHHHHHHNRHHHQDNLAPEVAPEPTTEGMAPAPTPRKSSATPWKSYSASPPDCHSWGKRRPVGNSGSKHSHLAPTLAPTVSPHNFPVSPPPYLYPSVPSPAPVSRSIPATSPLPNVVFAHGQPPSKGGSEMQHAEETPSVSPSPSPSCAGRPTKQWIFILMVLAAVFHL